ncbi:MAG: sulfotransferase [Acidobacteria bacterium]|nr:sulfotransferase [Acidobacteriota bacterium]
MPIVVGSPRSGTTLLRFMLDSHPALAIPPETGFLSLGTKIAGAGDKLRERFLRAVVNYPKDAPAWPDFGIPEEEFRAELARINPFTVADGFRAFYRAYAARFGKPRWGDKTPHYCFEIDTIRRVLPEARFVHIIRDGRDAALSLRGMWFSPGWRIEAQALYWLKYVRAARASGLGRPDYVEVRYEELVLAPREELRRVCAHVDLPFDDQMLSYYKRTPARLLEHKGRSRPDGTPLITQGQRLRQQTLTTKPPDPARVFAWKRTMDAEEVRRFGRVAGGLLTELGYEA